MQEDHVFKASLGYIAIKTRSKIHAAYILEMSKIYVK